ncbi:HD domain-containing phosphohydrolase [Pseudoalteromonas denitrificans]|uniref:Putative two-component system response regulator n=1 Tax=Pseudoalteromonas denitrificans DSM 6059 TaxID=1123010 RepID=A0A1I1MQR4_9GAMM|nr:HD domain-containing phosphohydrolase [Pseudoalteromonas denitrificans]SFC87525.1 putative two-component system response regulator [Pseudoalteromonas denitrificans DSM 6059]
MNEFSKDLNTELQKAKILIVDDEFTNIKLLKKMLSMNGYSNLFYTEDPTLALPLYLENQIDLVLLDLNMPQLNGFGVMQLLMSLQNEKKPSIIVLTAQHAQQFRQEALDQGARDYITKPFNTKELLSRVRNLLEVDFAHNYLSHQNRILEEKVNAKTQELRISQLQTVRHLGRAAEYRDNETGLHIIRMSKMACVLAKAAGLEESECELLLNAAPMHDIGKIGIPDHILLKPGNFLPEEWKIMQTHAQIGANVLINDDSLLMKMAHTIAISHHEKWNGKGYPNGLKGDEIPFVGRVTALADVFDALTSSRPYKHAWSVEKAVELIKTEKGQHFEPFLVDVFLQVLPELVEIKEKYAEPE